MSYTPRLITAGVSGNPYWESNKNIFYANGIYLPRSETYCFGRWWELADANRHFENKPHLALLDAYQWYNYAHDGYTRGNTPQLGAVACFDYNNHSVLKGAVAIVEELVSDPVLGDIAVCISGIVDEYDTTRFQTWYLDQHTNDIIDVYPYYYTDMTFQGFIYNPHTDGTLDPPLLFKPWLAKAIIDRRTG